VTALPPSGNPRATLGLALRSIFMTLRARKVIFTNPIARVPIGAIERREPLPVDVDVLRDLLNSSLPACAAIAALVAFHGLRSSELQDLRLIDVDGGRLRLDHRTVPLAPVVRERLASWLDHRQQRWPATVNPHVFIHRRNAGGVHATGGLWLTRTLGMAPNALRTDRILDEAIATRGDVRRLSDLFGIDIKTAERYTRILDGDNIENVTDA
jgi:integrase